MRSSRRPIWRAGLKTWASFGPPSGRTWRPADSELQRFPDARPLAPNPWTVLHGNAPAAANAQETPGVDVHDWHESELATPAKGDADPHTTAAWHGTLLPKTDADIWLASGFAKYERIVAVQHALEKKSKPGGLEKSDLERLAVAIFSYRSLYEQGARAGAEAPLGKTRASFRDMHWSQVTGGKGVLLLHSLRGLFGEKEFDSMMDAFGRKNAGREVTVAEFQAHVEKTTGKSWQTFFEPWLNQSGLPQLELGKCAARRVDERWQVSVTIRRDKNGPSLLVPLTIDTVGEEISRSVRLEQEEQTIEIATKDRPERVIVDKYCLAPHALGGPFSILTCENELDESLIVYGTLDEEAANRDAASLWQRAMRSRDQAVSVEIKKDREVTAEEMSQHHLLLVGRPDSNSLVARFRDALPVSFGPRSFVVRGEVYAHPESAVLMAAENPLNRRYSLVITSGLGSLATLQAVAHFSGETLSSAEVVVLEHNGDERPLVLPAKALTRDLTSSEKPNPTKK